jgi:TonB family protein
MRNLPKLAPVFLFVLFVVLACKNPFARSEPEIVKLTPTPLTNVEPSVFRTPEDDAIILNSKAESLPKPVYPKAAKAVKASGAVNVQVEVDEKGNVTTAKAVSGHPLLRAAAEQAAKQAKFKSSSEKLKGVIIYNFTAE